jgi:phospholipid/cholesterol/gamma-HCH transport system substrate-binding protein
MAHHRTRTAIGAEKPYDERLYRRGPRGLSRTTVGVIVAIVIVILTYLAFTKEIPFTGAGYEAKAVFENAATLRSDSPVRIAGVNVGEVTGVEPKGDATEVTFTVDEEGLPLHTDATIEIRPRLFLEGNFFLDTHPGSPEAPELSDGETIPITQTSVAVQLDQPLTALQKPDRENLGATLEGLGTGLNHKPTAEEDRTQDPAVQGESAGEAINDAFRYGGDAGRTAAIVNEALLGEEPRDLSRLILGNRRIFGALLSREEQLKDLITNFNVTTGALAAESGNLSATVRELAPTLEQAEPSLRHLSEALPPLRAFARELEPSIRELPGTITASGPWLRQAGKLLRKRELGGLASLLRRATPPLAATTRNSIGLLRQTGLTSLCASNVLVPTGNVVIDSAGGAYPFSTGQPNFREFFYTAAQQAGLGGGFDGNGTYLRLQPGGGNVMTRTTNPGGGLQNELLFSPTISAPLGTRPNLSVSPKPPFQTERACHRNPVPNLNGSGGGPGAIGPPQPEAIP